METNMYENASIVELIAASVPLDGFRPPKYELRAIDVDKTLIQTFVLGSNDKYRIESVELSGNKC